MFPIPATSALDLHAPRRARSRRQRAQVAQHRVEVGRLGEDVRPERAGAAVVSSSTGPCQRTASCAEPRRTSHGRPTDRLPRGLHAPASFHPQVAAQHEAALEAEEEVLADGLHGLEPPPVEPLGDAASRPRAGSAPRPASRSPTRHRAAAALGRRRERVALGHGATLARSTARRGPARKPASTSSGILPSLATGSAVEALDREPLRAAAPATWATSAASAGRSHDSSGSRSGTSERPPRSTKSDGLAAEQDDVRPGDPRRPRPRALRPRKRGAVGLRRIGGGEHERRRAPLRLRRAARAAARRRRRRANWAPPSPSTK